MQEKAKMTHNSKRRVQARLAEGQLTLDNWDARRTEDNKVSVIDVIADVRSVSYDHAAHIYRRMLSEERMPQCEMRRLPPRTHLSVSTPGTNNQRRSGGFSCTAQPTPVATVRPPRPAQRRRG